MTRLGTGSLRGKHSERTLKTLKTRLAALLLSTLCLLTGSAVAYEYCDPIASLGYAVASDSSSGSLEPRSFERSLLGFSGCALCSSRNVDDFVAVRAPGFNRIQQTSTRGPQQVQQQSLADSRILQISISTRIWFGTRGSEVQILSPRPIFSST